MEFDDKKPTILIVDDEKANLDVLNNILKDDYMLIMAKTGANALKRAKEDVPDLILLDVVMPDMNGFEVLYALKEMDGLRDIPVIFITGLNSVEDEERGFMLGATDYITKPFHNAIVKARVKSQMQIVKHIRTIERVGNIDALTDIPNRRSFDQTISTEWARAVREKEPICLITLDVDKFKLYNDTYGHPQGDVLLQTLAKILMGEIQRSTDFIARVGGEEFSVILPNTDLEGGLSIAERIRKAVVAYGFPNEVSPIAPYLTVSLGVACMMPTIEDKIGDLVSRSDQALYDAKTGGRNQVAYFVEGLG